MEGKSGTYLNGANAITGSQPGMRPQNGGSLAALRGGRILWPALLAGAAICSAFVLTAVPNAWMWESIRLLGIGIFLLFVLVWAFRFSNAGPKPAFLLWWLVLVSESLFWRAGDETANAVAYHGQFPTAAYGEVISCIFCLVAAILLWAPLRRQLGQLFTGDYKWLTLFALAVVASCAYAPRPSYSLAWSIKLVLVALCVVLCSIQVRDYRDTVSFLCFTFWGYLLVVLVPVVLGLMSGSPFDEDGRMSPIVSPDQLGPDAGAVFLLALTLYSRVRDEGLRRAAIVVGAGALIITILAGSKAGILSTFLAGTLFFILRGRVGSALSYIGIAVLLLFGLAFFTPLGSYFTHYAQTGDAGSLSGRTMLWNAVMPAIKQKPIVGHGYLASTFVEFQVNAVRWAAPHLHNGFVEVLYNNGLIGLILILMVNVVIGRNLIRVLRRARSDSAIHRFATGSFVIFAYLFVNGMTNASFGAKARPPFMLLIGLILVSHKLLEFVSVPSAAPSANAVQNLKPEAVTSADLVSGALTINPQRWQ
jgi:O-antigen ligase